MKPSPDEPVYVVFNPQSGKGRGARLIQPVLEAFSRGGPVEHGVSAGAGEEGRLAEAALARGFRTIAAVGGDGTWSNVGNAILRSGQGGVRLGIIAGGTGCDLAKSLGIPARDVAAAVRVIRQGHVRKIDVGRIEQRYFLNVAGFGYDVAVIEDSWRVRRLSGSLLYLYCALRQLYRFPGFPVTLEAEEEALGPQELLMLVLANARVFGGGFRIAPRAELGDGRLDVMAFRNMGVKRRLVLLVRLLRGTHEGVREVLARRGTHFRMRFRSPPAYETDGEWNRAQSAELAVECVPGALAVLVPGPS